MKYSTRAVALLTALLLAAPAALHAAEPAKPNIVFIFADDWGWGDLSCHGHPWLKTPNLDQLAREGTDFQQFNVLNPVCSPSRTAVMTGLYPARFSIHQHFAAPAENQARGMPDWLDPRAPTLPRFLKQAGYRTAHFGKWHLTNRATHGAPKPEAYGYDEASVFNGGAEWPSAGLHATASNAVAFIRANKDRPFFMNVWLHESHTPHVPTAEAMARWKDLDAQQQVYAAVITDGDHAVGAILDALKAEGLADNTLVMFSSDNGPESTGGKANARAVDPDAKVTGYDTYYSIGETGGLRGRKRSLFEGGVRTPFLVRWPGHTPAGTTNQATAFTAVDLLPTLCAAAGVTLPADYHGDGENLLAALEGQAAVRTRPIFWEWRGTKAEPDYWPRLAVRDGDWKLAMTEDAKRVELHRLSDDRAEAKDVAKEHPDVVARLSRLALDWKATLPPQPDPACTSRGPGARVDALKPIDWPQFMKRQDMVWNKIPTSWLEAPYLGNGKLGLLLFQEAKGGLYGRNPESSGGKNVLSLHVGRGDYFDNRPPEGGKDHTWIYRSRLPIGFFRIKSRGDVTGVDWRLDLWNAELTGKVTTTRGAYQIKALVHSRYDSFYVSTVCEGEESVAFEWQPQKAYSWPRISSEAVVKAAEAKGEPPSPLHKDFASCPYPPAPEPRISEEAGRHYCEQELHARSGELVTGWKVLDQPGTRTSTLVGSIHFAQRMDESPGKVQASLARAETELASGTYVRTHRTWWNEQYPLSFVSITDPFWEQFYWIQMYKFCSASRADSSVMDVMGPWYQPGFWPMIWTDLNVQLTYWTPLTANRLGVGESLPNQLDQYVGNLISNVPPDWRSDCLNANTIFPADMKAPVGKNVPDHLVWMLHNYWLHCRYADDQERMKTKLFPLLKRAVNTYFRYLAENPLDLKDGKIHTKSTWSPEYPAPWGPDSNYTLALLRWSCGALLDMSKAFELHDPLEPQWENILKNLTDYSVDEHGLRIGRNVPFDKSHRHYSHLLALYPLFTLSPEKDAALYRRSLEHWLDVTFDAGKKGDQAQSVCGYTCTGAASMYAALKDGNQALHYLRYLPFKNVSSTTMYAEGNPVIESPFSAATSIHDMLLQSWDGRLRVMPAVPDSWSDVHFRTLRAQGGLLVTAERAQKKLRFVLIESPAKPRTVEFTFPMEDPIFSVLQADGSATKVALAKSDLGFYRVSLDAGGTLKATSGAASLREADPVKSPAAHGNIFGFNTSYDRIIEAYKESIAPVPKPGTGVRGVRE